MSKYRNVSDIDNHMLFGNDYEGLSSVEYDAYDDYIDDNMINSSIWEDDVLAVDDAAYDDCMREDIVDPPGWNKRYVRKETREEIAERLARGKQLELEKREELLTELEKLMKTKI